jgi:zinc protease
MRPFVLTLALMLAAGTAGAGVFPYAYQTHALDNGLHVVLVPMPSHGLVGYYSVVRTGSRDEVEPGHSGFAHLFEHMMFRGTERYPGPVYDSLTTSLGANTNAYTTDDYTCYYMNFASVDLPRVIELEADRFQNLSYDVPAFQTETGAVYGEYRKNRTDPEEVLDEAIRDKAFDVHTYKHTTIGFERDVAAMPTMYDYSKSFFARFYRPENVVIVVAGDFDPKATLAEIRARYAGWKPGYTAPKVVPEPEQTAERSLEVSYPGRTLPILSIAWKGPGFDPASREVAAAQMLGDLLFGETSDLYNDLVLKRRLVQRLTPGFAASRDPGLSAVNALVTSDANLTPVREAIDGAVAKLQASGPDPSLLEDLKRRARYRFLMALDTPARVGGGLARLIALTGGIEGVDRYFETLAQVTPDDVKQAAKRYLTRGRRTVAVLKGVQS